MSSRWVDVVALGEGLIDMGLDERGRVRFAFTVVATKETSANYDEEVAAVLVAGGLSTGDIYLSSKAVVPDGPGPYVSVTLSGGLAGYRVHNVVTHPKYPRSSAFVMTIGLNTGATRDLAWQAKGLLTAVKNETVVA